MDKQEPVAWANEADLQNFDMRVRTNRDHYHTVPLYTAPPKREWVGMTDEEMRALKQKSVDDGMTRIVTDFEYIRSIEAKLKEKNT